MMHNKITDFADPAIPDTDLTIDGLDLDHTTDKILRHLTGDIDGAKIWTAIDPDLHNEFIGIADTIREQQEIKRGMLRDTATPGDHLTAMTEGVAIALRDALSSSAPDRRTAARIATIVAAAPSVTIDMITIDAAWKALKSGQDALNATSAALDQAKADLRDATDDIRRLKVALYLSTIITMVSLAFLVTGLV